VPLALAADVRLGAVAAYVVCNGRAGVRVTHHA
jgi:hypothetical protein